MSKTSKEGKITFHIHTLYKDFFTFLRRRGEDFWSDFKKYYIEKDKLFFEAYFQCFTYSQQMLEERVKATTLEHYSYLEILLKRNPPEEIVKRSIRKINNIISAPQEVNIYLIIGFFSADGFTIKVSGKPVIGLGLERMQNFSSIDIITAHEYAHFIRMLYGFESRNQFEEVINEGIATIFSQKAFPQKTLPEHLFLSNAEFNRLLLLKNKIIKCYMKTKKINSLEKMIQGKRVKNFIGYFVVKRYLARKKEASLEGMFRINSGNFNFLI